MDLEEKEQKPKYGPIEEKIYQECFSPDLTGFASALNSLTTHVPVVADGSLFRVRSFLYQESLIVGYLISDTPDYSVIAFPHMFSMEDGIEVRPLSGASYPLLKLYPKGSCLGSMVPDDKHTLIFLECTLARLPEMSGYFNPNRIASILAVKRGLMEKLDVSIVSSENGEFDKGAAQSPPSKTFTPPSSLKTRTKH